MNFPEIQIGGWHDTCQLAKKGIFQEITWHFKVPLSRRNGFLVKIASRRLVSVLIAVLFSASHLTYLNKHKTFKYLACAQCCNISRKVHSFNSKMTGISKKAKFGIEKWSYSAVSNKCACTIIFFGIFSKKFIKQDVIFYVMPKKSYVIPCTIIPYCTLIRVCRVFKFNTFLY